MRFFICIIFFVFSVKNLKTNAFNFKLLPFQFVDLVNYNKTESK